MPNSNNDQINRFKDAAREVDADQSDDALDRIMGKLDLKKKSDAVHASDCGLHNAPAYEAGACDCGAL
jgi:hypothetical protein